MIERMTRIRALLSQAAGANENGGTSPAQRRSRLLGRIEGVLAAVEDTEPVIARLVVEAMRIKYGALEPDDLTDFQLRSFGDIFEDQIQVTRVALKGTKGLKIVGSPKPGGESPKRARRRLKS